MIRMNNSELMLFSHAGDVDGSAGRWNMTVWTSADSGATWAAAVQVEPVLKPHNVTLHTAYSALLQLSPSTALIVYERGPMGSKCTPAYPHCYAPAGEYQTLRAREISLAPAE